MVNRIIIILIICFQSLGCSRNIEFSDLDGYFIYIKNNPQILTRSETVKDACYKLRLCTPVLLLNNEEKRNKNVDFLKSKLDTLSKSVNFIFIIDAEKRSKKILKPIPKSPNIKPKTKVKAKKSSSKPSF